MFNIIANRLWIDLRNQLNQIHSLWHSRYEATRIVHSSHLLLLERIETTTNRRLELRHSVWTSSLPLLSWHCKLFLLLCAGLQDSRPLLDALQHLEHFSSHCHCLILLSSSRHDVRIDLFDSTRKEVRIVGVDHIDQELAITLRLRQIRQVHHNTWITLCKRLQALLGRVTIQGNFQSLDLINRVRPLLSFEDLDHEFGRDHVVLWKPESA